MITKLALTSLLFLVLALLMPAILNPYDAPDWVYGVLMIIITLSGLGLLSSVLLVIWL